MMITRTLAITLSCALLLPQLPAKETVPPSRSVPDAVSTDLSGQQTSQLTPIQQPLAELGGDGGRKSSGAVPFSDPQVRDGQPIVLNVPTAKIAESEIRARAQGSGKAGIAIPPVAKAPAEEKTASRTRVRLPSKIQANQTGKPVDVSRTEDVPTVKELSIQAADTTDEGNSKPATVLRLAAPAWQEDIVVETVSFSRSTGEADAVLNANSQIPFLGIQTDSAESNLAQGLSALLELVESEGEPTILVERPVDAGQDSFLNDLHGLVEIADTAPPATDYLNELNELVAGQPQWVMTNGAFVDLGPPETAGKVAIQDTFMDDLRQLVPDHVEMPQPRFRPNTYSGSGVIAYNAGLRRNAALVPSESYEISDEANDSPPGQEKVGGLFLPVNSISVRGESTAPPKSSSLKRPDNSASGFMELDSPACYVTQGYGLRRAPRNTHRFCHNPLYFEDPNLERCGQSNGCLTTAASAVHFTTMFALTPYLTTANRPSSCVRALPDCPTCESFGRDAYFPKWSWKAAAVQAAAVTGGIYIIP